MNRARAARTKRVVCRDSIGRKRIAKATVDCAGDVFVTMPAGETGWFDQQQMIELIAALNELRGLSQTLHRRLSAVS